MNHQTPDFEVAVRHQVKLLNSGQVLEALDLYFNDHGEMYENDNLFARGKAECRKKQEPYINSAKEILGQITELNIVQHSEICIFRNQSRFIDQQNKTIHINGLHWQQWKNGKIIEERYYHADKIDAVISSGILSSPENFKNLWL